MQKPIKHVDVDTVKGCGVGRGSRGKGSVVVTAVTGFGWLNVSYFTTKQKARVIEVRSVSRVIRDVSVKMACRNRRVSRVMYTLDVGGGGGGGGVGVGSTVRGESTCASAGPVVPKVLGNALW